MKQLWAILMAVTAFNLNSDAKPQDDTGLDVEAGRSLYSARYDNLNTDTILKSPRLVTNYVDCLLNKRPCPPEGKDLKRILPEALRTKCSKCSQRQKEGALKVITKLYFSYPNHYNALREKWDPTGEYHRRLLEYLQEEQFNQIDSNFDKDTKVSEQTVKLEPVTRPIEVVTRPTTRFITTTTTRTTTRLPLTTARPTPTARPTTRAPPPPPPTTRRADSTTRATRSPSQSFGPVPQNSLPDPADIEVVQAQEQIVPQASNTRDPNTVLPAINFPSIVQQPPSVGNRFGNDEDDSQSPLAPPAQPPVHYQPSTYRPVSSPARPYLPPANNNNFQPLNHLINNFFIPPNQQSVATGPIAGIINEFGKKVTRTTEAIVDMIHNTARIISGTVRQSHNQS